VTEVQRQLPTLGLYREVVKLFTGVIDPRNTLNLFVLLFPGEARDNTGIKDLNDKVLHYQLNNEFIAARQEAVRTFFPPPGDTTGPRYITVGQDYKTASIVAVGKTPVEFAKELVRLDARLRELLLGFLTKAEDEEKNKEKNGKKPDIKRLDAIRTLRRTLEKDKDYRFDFIFGANTLGIRGKPVDVTFQLLTEALKGAGIARYAAKGQNVTTKVVRAMTQGRGIESPAKGHDPRGRVFTPGTFLKVSKTSDDIRKMISKSPNPDNMLDFMAVYVDTVWTTTFLLYRQVYFGNPDVIRDVRKKLLENPPLRAGVKMNFTAQKEMLELFLVTLNAIDFIKDFVSAEYPKHVEAYHNEALLILEELLTPKAIDWPRLSRYLTHDIRQGFETIAVQGTASEYQFYSYASDFPDQIFFAMDIRDLGVQLMAYYEYAHVVIGEDKLTGLDLMGETLASTDATISRRRVTYDSVVAVFKKHYPTAQRSRAAAEKSFGTALQTQGPMPDFRGSVRVMLGGDEVFVAAHPYYAGLEPVIIADLAKILFEGAPLDMRTGVAYSTAERAPARAGGGDQQRRNNQEAHDKTLKLATDSLTVLKPFERTQRRIERLIDKLEENDKKKDKAPDYRAKLRDLHLLEVFARAKPLSRQAYARLHQALLAGNLARADATDGFQLVDFSGAVMDREALEKKAAALEDAVRRDVGKDNIHIDPPPVAKVPAWIQKLIDKLDDKKKTA
jgi:hypothetical protein